MIHALRRIADLLCAEMPVLQSVDGYRPLLESIIRHNKDKYQRFNVSGYVDTWIYSGDVTKRLMNDLCFDFSDDILTEWKAPHTKKERFYSAFVAFVAYEFRMYGQNPYEFAPTFGYTLHNLTNRISKFDDIKKYVDSTDE
jgi:hypothetical protein